MKHYSLLCLGAALFLSVRASALTIPSDGSDGAFNPSGNIVVDLSLASTGAWDANNSGNAGLGIYDSSKWAVVFKYSSVDIPAGVTVTFKNHPTYAPVVWLVSGNVTIAGTVNIAGKGAAMDATGRLTPPEPGPGGFRGAAEGPAGIGAGFGPGGGISNFGGGNGVGKYAAAYGNPQIIPLIGGSGSGAISGGYSGAGGGAILIATPGTITISGLIDANGGIRADLQGNSGSGGAVRLIAQQVSGAGQVRALFPSPFSGNSAGYGRIRIETPVLAPTVQVSPETIGVVPPSIPIIWPAADAPTVRIVSVDGVTAPLDPTAPLVSAADVPIQNNGTVQVILETRNFPISGVVQLRTVRKFGVDGLLTATRTSGDFNQATWVVNTAFIGGFTSLQARATVP